jgi:hypothetical protein
MAMSVALAAAIGLGMTGGAVIGGAGSGPPLQPLNSTASPNTTPAILRNRPATRVPISPHLRAIHQMK